MLEQYKVLAAGAVLREFTVDDVVRYSDVKRPTVLTVLDRNTRYFEKLDRKATGKRGGQPRTWRVRHEQVEQLLAELDSIGDHVAVHRPGADASQEAVDALARVAVAEDALFRLVVSDDEEERRLLEQLSERSLESATVRLGDVVPAPDPGWSGLLEHDWLQQGGLGVASMLGIAQLGALSGSSYLSGGTLKGVSPHAARHQVEPTLAAAMTRLMAASLLHDVVVGSTQAQSVRPALAAQVRTAMEQLELVAPSAVVEDYANALRRTPALSGVSDLDILPPPIPAWVIVFDEPQTGGRRTKLARAIAEAAKGVCSMVELVGSVLRPESQKTLEALLQQDGTGVCLLAYGGAAETLPPVLREMSSTCGVQIPKVVITQDYEGNVSRAALGQRARYYSMGGLDKPALRWALRVPHVSAFPPPGRPFAAGPQT
jgi:hypothetical protein